MSISATEANAAKAALVENAIRTPWSEFWRKFRKQHVALGAGIFVLLLVAVAILAPHIVPYDPENFFDYDALNAGPRPRTGSVSIRWAAIFLAAFWRVRVFRSRPVSCRWRSVR